MTIAFLLVIFALLAYSVYKDRLFEAERHDLLLKIMAKSVDQYERSKMIEKPIVEKKQKEVDNDEN
ncbi:MAG: hypothetical protein NUV65_03000, partial [Candidatus Roizmanbacteria bacterium]|nr:hypothetical protein [Candidatus Roizmanbacteria bacterium]